MNFNLSEHQITYYKENGSPELELTNKRTRCEDCFFRVLSLHNVCSITCGDDKIFKSKEIETIPTGKKDINGVMINTTDRFTFDYVDIDDNRLTFEGSFEYNEDEMRWEVNIYDDPMYVVLWYDVENMSNFKLLEK